MSLKYYGRKVYDKRNGQICRPQKCRVKFGKVAVIMWSTFGVSQEISIMNKIIEHKFKWSGWGFGLLWKSVTYKDIMLSNEDSNIYEQEYTLRRNLLLSTEDSN